MFENLPETLNRKKALLCYGPDLSLEKCFRCGCETPAPGEGECEGDVEQSLRASHSSHVIIVMSPPVTTVYTTHVKVPYHTRGFSLCFSLMMSLGMGCYCAHFTDMKVKPGTSGLSDSRPFFKFLCRGCLCTGLGVC